MNLGELIQRFEDEDVAASVLEQMDDVALVARVKDVAVQHGVQPGEFVARAVTHFASHAGDEEWLTLLGIMSRVPDPGSEFLKRALLHAMPGKQCQTK